MTTQVADRGALGDEPLGLSSGLAGLARPQVEYRLMAQHAEVSMNTNGQPPRPIDAARYLENRQKMPWDLLEPHRGRWVAINEECTQVLAADENLLEAERKLAALGIPGDAVAWFCVPGLEDGWP